MYTENHLMTTSRLLGFVSLCVSSALPAFAQFGPLPEQLGVDVSFQKEASECSSYLDFVTQVSTPNCVPIDFVLEYKPSGGSWSPASITVGGISETLPYQITQGCSTTTIRWDAIADVGPGVLTSTVDFRFTATAIGGESAHLTEHSESNWETPTSSLPPVEITVTDGVRQLTFGASPLVVDDSDLTFAGTITDSSVVASINLAFTPSTGAFSPDDLKVDYLAASSQFQDSVLDLGSFSDVESELSVVAWDCLNLQSSAVGNLVIRDMEPTITLETSASYRPSLY